MKHKWEEGWGIGVTGPTTPTALGPCCGGRDWTFGIIRANEETIAICPDQDDRNGKPIEGSGKEHAKRIVACVNACEGINPEAVPDMLAAVKAMIAWDDAESVALPYNDDGGKAWKERLELCKRAFVLGRKALAKAKEVKDEAAW